MTTEYVNFTITQVKKGDRENKGIHELHADLCKFMGHPKRIEMLFLLGEGELCVEELAKQRDIKTPTGFPWPHAT